MKRIALFILLALAFSANAKAETWFTVKADSVQPYGIMFVPVKIQGVKFSHVLVDTGASMVQLPYRDYVAMQKNGMLKKARFVKNSEIAMGSGVFKTKIYAFDKFEIGGVTLDNVWITFCTKPGTFPLRIMGQNIFRRFHKMCVDWDKNELSLIR